VVLAAALLASCTGPGSALRSDASRAYPSEIANAGTLPIQVIRRVTHIEMTNTTARAFGPSTIWVNGRYSHPIEGFGIGETISLDLREFYDEFGERFRAGGFFATRDPDALVLCQLENEGSMYGLIVVGNLLE